MSVRRLRAALAAIVLAAAGAGPATAAAGDLDTRFSDDGIATAFVHGAIGTALAVDSQGRTVVVGYTVDGAVDVAVARFRVDGTPDPTFGQNGRARLDLGADDYALDAAVTGDDGLVIVGRQTRTTGDLAFVLRLAPDGATLASFGGGDGVVTTGFNKPYQAATAVALASAGRIVIGGYTSNGTTTRTAFARYLPDGSPDPSFGGDGRYTVNLANGAEQANDLVIRDDGSIVAAGYVEQGLEPSFGVVRVLAGGGLDARFGTDGLAIVDVSVGADIAYGIAMRSDGSLAIVGSADDGGRASWGVVRLRGGGGMDRTFSDDGIVLLRFTSASEEATGVLATGERLVVVGRIRSADAGEDLGVVRLKSDGARDGSFGGGDGVMRIDVDGRNDWATDAARTSHGRIMVGGTATRDGTRRLVAVRLLG